MSNDVNDERRKSIIAGMTISEWILLFGFITGGFTVYFTLIGTAGAADARSQKNEEAITSLYNKVQNELERSEHRVKEQLKNEIEVVRDDIRELRQLIINRRVVGGNGQ